jgi:hypothetical protein
MRRPAHATHGWLHLRSTLGAGAAAPHYQGCRSGCVMTLNWCAMFETPAERAPLPVQHGQAGVKCCNRGISRLMFNAPCVSCKKAELRCSIACFSNRSSWCHAKDQQQCVLINTRHLLLLMLFCCCCCSMRCICHALPPHLLLRVAVQITPRIMVRQAPTLHPLHQPLRKTGTLHAADRAGAPAAIADAARLAVKVCTICTVETCAGDEACHAANQAPPCGTHGSLHLPLDLAAGAAAPHHHGCKERMGGARCMKPSACSMYCIGCCVWRCRSMHAACHAACPAAAFWDAVGPAT